MSDYLNLDQTDFIKGAITTVFAAVLAVLFTVTQQAGFDVFSTDWVHVGSNVVNTSVITLMAYLAKNFLTNNRGEFLESDR